MSRTDLEFIDHVPMRISGTRMVDTYAMVTRFNAVDEQDPCSTSRVYHAIDGDTAEELLFSYVRWHHGHRLVAHYEWPTQLETFVLIGQQPGVAEFDAVDFDTWSPDADLAVLDRAEVPGMGHEFWLEDMPMSASFDEVTQAEYDAAVRPVSKV